MYDARCAYEHPLIGSLLAHQQGEFSELGDAFSVLQSTLLQDAKPSFGSQYSVPMHLEPSLLGQPTGMHSFSAPFIAPMSMLGSGFGLQGNWERAILFLVPWDAIFSMGCIW